MQTTYQALEAGRKGSAINKLKPAPHKIFVRKLLATCLAITMTTVPITRTLADGNFTVLQYEFSLEKKPEFRQLNLSFQYDYGEPHSHHRGEVRESGPALPLYSKDSRIPGLFNLLNNDSGETSDSNTGQMVVAYVALVGLLGLMYYVEKERCKNEEVTSTFDAWVTGCPKD